MTRAACTPVVVGVGATRYAPRSAASEAALGTAAILAALRDAQLTPGDVDGVVRFDREAVWEFDLTAGLGVRRLDFYNAVPFGAGSTPALLRMAALAIRQSLATVIVGWHARNRAPALPPPESGAQWQVPFGVTDPAHATALLMRRHMICWGTTADTVARVTTLLRRHAARNPRAVRRRPLTRSAHRRSAFVAEPLRRADLAVEASGACAFIVTSLERARDLPRRPVRILGSAQAVVSPAATQLGTWLGDGRERAMDRAAAALWRNARVRPADADVVFLHDAASPLVLLGVEDWGFCPRGEGAAFLGRRRPVVNPNGGQVGEASLDGINNLIAAVEQVRGTARPQIGGVEVAMVAGSALEPTSAVVLGV